MKKTRLSSRQFDLATPVWMIPAAGQPYGDRTVAARQNEGTNLMHPKSLIYEDLFRDLPPVTREAFQAIEVRKSYPAGSQLFLSGQTASGIFIVHTGSVTLSESCSEGRSPSSRIALPGEIVGVAATVSGDRHQLEACTVEPSEIGFIEREDLMYFLRTHGAAAFRLVQLLSHTLDAALEYARLLPPVADA